MASSPLWVLLADENVQREIVDRLRADGHAVRWIDEFAKGLPDPAVLALAISLHLPLLTGDLDFGGYVYRDHLAVPPEGIVQYRLHRQPVDRRVDIVATFFQQHSPVGVAGYFVTIDEHGLRFRPLP